MARLRSRSGVPMKRPTRNRSPRRNDHSNDTPGLPEAKDIQVDGRGVFPTLVISGDRAFSVSRRSAKYAWAASFSSLGGLPYRSADFVFCQVLGWTTGLKFGA